jgi:SAM-dependent methyltransferase
MQDLSHQTGIEDSRGADWPASGDSAAARCIPALSEYPDGVIYEVSPRDHMYSGYDPDERAGYFSHGRTALDCIRVALIASQKERPQSILDLPSGHGRVLRFLKAEYPEAQLAACDIDQEAVDFCAQTFGAAAVYGHEHPAEIEVEARFDLIWCGSLLTHLDSPKWVEFFDFFESVLGPGGILIFTTCGRNIAARLSEEETGKGLMSEADRRELILRGFEEEGFGYCDYHMEGVMRDSLSLPENFGISAAQPSWVCRMIEGRPGLQLVTYTENRWGAQDVVTCLRVDDVGHAYPFRTPMTPYHPDKD